MSAYRWASHVSRWCGLVDGLGRCASCNTFFVADVWTFEDGWMLAAIATSSQRRSHSWAKILFAADAMNRAVPSRDVLVTSVNRLALAGWVDPLPVPRATDAVKPLWKRAQKGRTYEIPKRLAQELNAIGAPPTAPGPWTLSEDEYAEAVRLYDEYFDGMLRWTTLPWKRNK
jgi:hypothetical protein